MRKTTFEVEKSIQPIYNGGDVALDADGRILATCLDEEVILTDLSNGKPLARIPGDGEALTALLITPSGSHVITCSRSLSMRIYALSESDELPTLEATLVRTVKPHATPVVSAAIDATGTLLATGGADGAVKVWDIRAGYVSHTFRGHSGVISALHFFETSNAGAKRKIRPTTNGPSHKQQNHIVYHLASGGEDGRIRVWDLEQRKAVASLDSHVSVVRAFDYARGMNMLASASRDRTIILWDSTTWKMRVVIPVLEELESVGLLYDGTHAFSGGKGGRIRIWDTTSGAEIT